MTCAAGVSHRGSGVSKPTHRVQRRAFNQLSPLFQSESLGVHRRTSGHRASSLLTLMTLRIVTSWIVITLLAATLSTAALGQTIDAEKVATIKAAYILNFIKYTQWPHGRFTTLDEPIILTVVMGDGGNNEVLEAAVKRSDRIDGRRLEMRQLAYPPADAQGKIDPEQLAAFFVTLEQSHAVYVTGLYRDRVRQIADHVRGKDVLTIGDTHRFAEMGGMLGLVLKESRVVFQANPGEIQKTKLTVSAKVLKLAEIVETSPN